MGELLDPVIKISLKSLNTQYFNAKVRNPGSFFPAAIVQVETGMSEDSGRRVTFDDACLAAYEARSRDMQAPIQKHPPCFLMHFI